VIVVSASTFDFYHNERQLLGVDTRKRNATESAAVLEALTPVFEDGAFGDIATKSTANSGLLCPINVRSWHYADYLAQPILGVRSGTECQISSTRAQGRDEITVHGFRSRCRDWTGS
jgi:hypothetical protein